MRIRSWAALALAGALMAGAGGAFAQDNPPGAQPGHAPGATTPAPSVDTGNAGTPQFPVRETTDPNATGATGQSGAAVNPPGAPPGTITPGPKNAIDAGVSGRNNCYPGQTGKAVGSTNPTGMPSKC